MFNADMRVRVASLTAQRKPQYLYPDCSVVCGEPEIHDGDNLLNPQLIVEVLSPSSEDYDRGKKFALYRSIPSMSEYLVFHQDPRHVEHYSKQADGSWVLREYSGGAAVPIPRWSIEISLAEVYEKTIGLDDGTPD